MNEFSQEVSIYENAKYLTRSTYFKRCVWRCNICNKFFSSKAIINNIHQCPHCKTELKDKFNVKWN